MTTTLSYARIVARWIVAQAALITRLAGRFTLWLLAKTWGGVKRCGRVVLWVGFWPLGLWRSIVHSQRKRA